MNKFEIKQFLKGLVIVVLSIIMMYLIIESGSVEREASEIIVEAERAYKTIVFEQCSFLLEENGWDKTEASREAEANGLECNY